MENINNNNAMDARADMQRDQHADNRWRGNRRRVHSRGYTYVSMVGWIDRREKKRRKGDSDTY